MNSNKQLQRQLNILSIIDDIAKDLGIDLTKNNQKEMEEHFKNSMVSSKEENQFFENFKL